MLSYNDCLKELNAKRVTGRVSEDKNFIVFNYCPDVEFKKTWNEINVWCRGIIFDNNTKELVALPFKKFWNVDQVEATKLEVLKELFNKGIHVRNILCKIDGSLGVTFYDQYQDKIRISTRGNLDSDQAIWATKWINNTSNYFHYLNDYFYEDFKEHIKTSEETYLFEIIYKENRVVLSYEDEGIRFLNTVNKKTGKLFKYPTFKKLPYGWYHCGDRTNQDIESLIFQSKHLKGIEGFVVIFDNDLMVKIKTDEYIKLHRARFGLSEQRIKECLIDGIDPLIGLDGLPDEFIQEVTLIKENLLYRFNQAVTIVNDVLAYTNQFSERKDKAIQAQYCLESKYLPAFFNLLDSKEEAFKNSIWNII